MSSVLPTFITLTTVLFRLIEDHNKNRDNHIIEPQFTEYLSLKWERLRRGMGKVV